MIKIAILTGGDSAEYEISLQSANVVLDNLDPEKYEGTIIHLKNREFNAIIDGNYYVVDKNNFTVKQTNSVLSFDYVFMALHGPPAENGDIQNFFDNLNIPYSSCMVLVSAMTFNKFLCNHKLISLGFKCPNSICLNNGDKIDNNEIIKEIGLPCFIKPNQSGSSFGVSKVKSNSQITEAIKLALEHDNKVLIEQFIDGVEISCGVGILHNKITAFPITEIVSQNDFFDFEAKYKGLSKEITPARISKKITGEVQKITEAVYSKMNLKGISRIDFIIMNDIPYIIEINTIPGLSNESIIPKQAKELGITLMQLFDHCIESTIK